VVGKKRKTLKKKGEKDGTTQSCSLIFFPLWFDGGGSRFVSAVSASCFSPKDIFFRCTLGNTPKDNQDI